MLDKKGRASRPAIYGDEGLLAHIELASATHKPLLRELLCDYLAESGSDSDYPYFDAYWEEVESRWPYLILQDDHPMGFAFVNTWSASGKGTDFSIAEFYIIPNARRYGIGRDAATAVLRTHPGLWELSVMPLNAPAQEFWPRVIEAADGRDVERIQSDGKTIYRFVISPKKAGLRAVSGPAGGRRRPPVRGKRLVRSVTNADARAARRAVHRFPW